MHEFRPKATKRNMLRRNEDLVVTACKPWSTEEQFELLQRYLQARHPGGGMTEMDEMDFADIVEQHPVDSYVIEYTEPSAHGIPGQLVRSYPTDRRTYGLARIYTFFGPYHATPPTLCNYTHTDPYI